MLNLICLIPVLAVGWAPADETSGPFNGLDRQVRLTGKPTLTEAIDRQKPEQKIKVKFN